jgi:hypothetical protein
MPNKPAKGKRKIVFSETIETKEALEEIARENDLTLTDVLQIAIHQFLHGNPPPGGNSRKRSTSPRGDSPANREDD